jgi:hypothetical protein
MRKFSIRSKGIKLLVLTLCLLVTTQLFASHFRYGNITATRLSETSTQVTYRLNVTTAWRLGTGDPNTFTISGGNSGSINVPMTFVTDPSGGWTNGSGTAVVTLNKSATPTRIEWSSCCKISDLTNNRDQNWDVFTVLNTGAPGSTPVSTLPAIINMPVNAAAATYTIPASDPDAGSTLTYAFAPMTGFLAGQTQPSGLSINSATGQLTFNTVGKSVGQLYNAMVTVTDNHGNLIELDFIIRMVGASNPPAFDYSVTPTNGAVFNVIAGQNISFPIRATDPDLGSTVGLSVAGLPAYITTSNFSPAMPATGNPSTTNFSWTPAAAQIGSTVVLNFIATDNVGVQSTTSVTIKVVAEPAPVFISPSPGEGTIRQIVPGVVHQDVITASSSLGSNVSIAFATIPGGSLSPSVPTAGANPGTTTFSWTPTVANWGERTLTFQATIANVPSIFSTLSYKLIVNTPPAFTSTPAVTAVNAGQSFSYTITAIDPDLPYGDVLDITAAGLPSWLTLVDNGNGTATLSGTPTVADGGTYHIHLHAEDIYHHGNAVHVGQEFDITVVTNKPPVAVCKPVTVNTTSGCQGNASAAAFNNGSTDPDGDALTFSVSPAGPYNLGTTSVTLTVTDPSGASSSCTTTVTVKDNVFPTIVPPLPVTVTAAQGTCSVPASAVILGTPVVNDNCSVASLTNDAPASFPVGQTAVTWIVTDGSGNTNIAYQRVIVLNNDAPSIASAPAVVVGNDAGICGANVAITAPAASVTCSNSECASDNIDSYSAGAVSGQSAKWTPWPGGGVSAVVTSAQSFSGNNSVRFTNDQDQLYLLGNKSSGKWDLSWKMYIPVGRTAYYNTQQLDVPGVFFGQQVIFASNGTGAVQATGTFTPFTYPQGQWFDVKQTFDLDADQTTIYINGTAVKSWQYSKRAGNQNGAAQLGSIDFFAQTWNQAGLEPNPAAPSEFYVDDIKFCGGNDAVVSGVRSDAQALDAVYPVGTTTITWTANGNGGSTATTQTITVNDTEAPVVVTKNISVTLVNGAVSITAADVNNGSSDNCGVQSISINKTSFTCTNIGANTVVLTVTDVHGNSASANAVVTVVGAIPAPVVTVTPSNSTFTGLSANTIALGYGAQSANLTGSNNTSAGPTAYAWTASAGLSNINGNPAVFTPSAAGTYSFSGTATNEYGCTAPISATVKVIDVRCGNKNDKVLVCQKTNSAKNPWVQICIAPAAVATHLANGSTLGNCPAVAARGVTPEAVAKVSAGKIYPNPNKGVFELQLIDYTAGKVQVQVVDAYGKLVSDRSIEVSSQRENFSFDMSAQASGVYYVRVVSAEGVKTLRMALVK